MECNCGGERFVAVADDGGDAGEDCQFFSGALGIAASGDDTGCGVEAISAADVGAGFAIGLGGNAACVDNDHIGLGGLALVSGRGT